MYIKNLIGVQNTPKLFLKIILTSRSKMLTFIELPGFSKRHQVLLPDDEFRAFQEWGNVLVCGLFIIT